MLAPASGAADSPVPISAPAGAMAFMVPLLATVTITTADMEVTALADGAAMGDTAALATLDMVAMEAMEAMEVMDTEVHLIDLTATMVDTAGTAAIPVMVGMAVALEGLASALDGTEQPLHQEPLEYDILFTLAFIFIA